MLSPRGQSGLEAKILAPASASASKLWPRPRHQTFGLGLASISLSYYVIGHFSGKNRGIFVNFSAIILNRMLLTIIWYTFFIIIFGLGLNLQKLASASASRFWPRLTSCKQRQLAALTLIAQCIVNRWASHWVTTSHLVSISWEWT